MIKLPLNQIKDFLDSLGPEGDITITLDTYFEHTTRLISPLGLCLLDRYGENHLVMIYLFDIKALKTIGPVAWRESLSERLRFSSDGRSIKGPINDISISSFVEGLNPTFDSYANYLIDFLSKRECFMSLHSLLSSGFSRRLPNDPYKVSLTFTKDQLLRDLTTLVNNYPT